MIKKLVFVAVFLSMSGCAGVQSPFYKKPVVDNKNDVVMDGLFEAASQVRDELRKMNTESGRAKSAESSSFSGCSTKVVSIDFDGDMMLFVDDMQKAGICKIRVNGKRPRQDLVLSLHHKKVPLWQVLEDAGVQLGSIASVAVMKNDVIFTFQGGLN